MKFIPLWWKNQLRNSSGLKIPAGKRKYEARFELKSIKNIIIWGRSRGEKHIWKKYLQIICTNWNELNEDKIKVEKCIFLEEIANVFGRIEKFVVFSLRWWKTQSASIAEKNWKPICQTGINVCIRLDQSVTFRHIWNFEEFEDIWKWNFFNYGRCEMFYSKRNFTKRK